MPKTHFSIFFSLFKGVSSSNKDSEMKCIILHNKFLHSNVQHFLSEEEH